MRSITLATFVLALECNGTAGGLSAYGNVNENDKHGNYDLQVTTTPTV